MPNVPVSPPALKPRSLLARLRADRRGVAAVEFALILPLMLLLYLGSTQIVQSLMASRKLSIVARSLSDLVAQQPSGTNLTDTQLNDIFAAASSIMSPFSTSSLKMTVSSVEFAAKTSPAVGFDAKPRWTVQRNGSTPRPCSILTPVANASLNGVNNMPTGLYAAGSIIVADVSYTYTPAFGAQLLAWSTSDSTVRMSRTLYMRPRAQTLIAYSGTAGTKCAAY
ncbi:MAG: pilus assembly protein [Beijerinckiaceae bacterium]|jgi:Flp pilus assembly protein TadG|nr:pilus assembly protein [Beijerinckiaceae bacterium]MDO9439993.1 TadE/TadG family type IV pilus assembly protein [Beijerinckiaceae bacterium]